MMRAKVIIHADDRAEILARILNNEAREEMSRSEVHVARDGNDLVLRITAEDAVSLRAALNSYLRWTNLAVETNNTIGGLK